MSPGDVRTFQLGKRNAVVIGLGLWAKKQGKWIQIHMTGPNDLHTTVTNNPDSVRHHRTLFRDLRRTLVDQGCWSYGDEGSEIDEALEDLETESPNSLKKAVTPRFQPIRAKGGASASEIILRDRGER